MDHQADPAAAQNANKSTEFISCPRQHNLTQTAMEACLVGCMARKKKLTSQTQSKDSKQCHCGLGCKYAIGALDTQKL